MAPMERAVDRWCGGCWCVRPVAVGHVPPVDHLFMPDFHLFMAAEDEEDDDDEQQPGRRHAMHHPHTAGVGHLPPHREPRMHDGRPSASGCVL